MNQTTPTCKKCLKHPVDLEHSKNLCFMCWFVKDNWKKKQKGEIK